MDIWNSIITILSCVMTVAAIFMAWLYRRRLLQEREIEQRLKRLHDNLDFALQSGKMGTWDIHLKDGTVYCSQEMLDIWGVTAKEYNNKRTILQAKVHPDDVDRMKMAIDDAISTDGLYELEYRIFPTPGQMRWVLSRGRCSFVNGSHRPEKFSGVVFDITESKMREEALQNAIRTRDLFLALAGQELKTPLTNMQLNIQSRQRALKRSPEEATSIDRVSECLVDQMGYVSRLSRVVDNILDTSQIAEHRLQLSYEYFDICKLVADVVERFPGVRFSTPPPIHGNWDWFRLEQVLVNLLTNAVKFGEGKPIHVHILQGDGNVEIVVRDNGIGISKEDQARIFERFECVPAPSRACGLGLGLYIANTIVHLHGGEIHVQSSPGAGSEFTVSLPMDRVF